MLGCACGKGSNVVLTDLTMQEWQISQFQYCTQQLVSDDRWQPCYVQWCLVWDCHCPVLTGVDCVLAVRYGKKLSDSNWKSSLALQLQATVMQVLQLLLTI